MIDEHFSTYKNLVTKLEIKSIELIKLKEDFYTITGTHYDDMPKSRGGIKITIEDKLHNIVEKEKDLKGIEAYKNEVRRIHEKEIERVVDQRSKTILRLFYLDGYSLKEISYCLRITEGHVKKLKRGAVYEFIKKNKELFN